MASICALVRPSVSVFVTHHEPSDVRSATRRRWRPS